MAHFFPDGAEPKLRQAARRRRVQGARSQDRALEHSRHRQAHRRPRPQDRAPDRRGSRRAAAHPRLGAVHPRRDPGAGGRHARHRRGRAVDRRAAGHLQGNVPAALQLPALLGRRDRPHGRARPARDRPRQARLARDPSDAAGADEFPYTIRVVSEITEFERLVLDGDGVRHLAGADGCRRAAASGRPPASPWASSWRTSASPCCPTSSATRIISATWTSRWPAPRRASPRCRWTSRSPASPRRS